MNSLPPFPPDSHLRCKTNSTSISSPFLHYPVETSLCGLDLSPASQLHVEWSKPVPKEINHFNAFLPTTHSAFLPNFSPQGSQCCCGATSVFVVACLLRLGDTHKGDVLLGAPRNTGAPGLIPCQVSSICCGQGPAALPQGNGYSWPECPCACTTQGMCHCIHAGGPAS